MSEKREISEEQVQCKRQKISDQVREEENQEQEEQCIVCMRTEPELLAADCPMRETHGCPRCTKTSW
jgi:hypothetical protein